MLAETFLGAVKEEIEKTMEMNPYLDCEGSYTLSLESFPLVSSIR